MPRTVTIIRVERTIDQTTLDVIDAETANTGLASIRLDPFSSRKLVNVLEGKLLGDQRTGALIPAEYFSYPKVSTLLSRDETFVTMQRTCDGALQMDVHNKLLDEPLHLQFSSKMVDKLFEALSSPGFGVITYKCASSGGFKKS